MRAKMSAKDYEAKVPEDVRTMNNEKLASQEKEILELKKAVASIERAMK